MKTVYLNLERLGACRGFISSDDSPRPAPIDQLRLGPDDPVTIRDLQATAKPLQYSLAELVRVLVDFNRHKLHEAFEERGQFAIGQHLYQETLGRLQRYDGEADIDLRILTDDEHLGRLPWPLLAHRGLFLVNQGWSVSFVTQTTALPDVELPPAPKFLMVVPQPSDLGATEGDEHRDALRRLLGTFSPRMSDADHFHVAMTWEDFLKQTRANTYDVVYYYGHGEGDLDQSRLMFETTGRPEPRTVALREFADALRGSHPKLIYLNCCSGDAGGWLGAGRQLAHVTPCVITNRTLASVVAAKAQAISFWQQVLLDGTPPHVAAARNYQSLGELGLSSLDPHWFTPVIYANYHRWSSNPPERDRSFDSHWKLKLDRDLQFARVLFKTQDTVKNRRPRALAFLWFGEEGEGMTLFHERLEVELQPRFNVPAQLVLFRPRWPDRDMGAGEPRFSTRAFKEMLLEVFQIESLSQISGRVRDKAGNGRAIVVLNHPHSLVKQMPPPLVLEYVKWWNDHVVRHLDDDEHVFLLGFSYRAKNVEKFQNDLLLCGFGKNLSEVNTMLLPPLLSLSRNELLEILQTLEVYIPLDRINEYLDHLLKRTNGRYEATIVELEKLVVHGYDEVLHRDAAGRAGESNGLFAEEDD